jgi:DMSO/TMAO reductase YedYZ molybdopterin-dependent catalytic subunit
MSKTYTERKIAWAEKMRSRGARADLIRSKDRLPPGQHVVEKLPVLDLGIHPKVAKEAWSLEIKGLVEKPLVLDWSELISIPSEERVCDFHCVTTWSKYDCRWRGIPLSAILDLVQPTEDARFVFFTAHDGYTTNTPVDALTHPDAMLAHTLEGAELSVEHGGPLRVIIPQLYGWKGAKWVRSLEFHSNDTPGYWEERGYSMLGDPWLNDRFA